METEEIVIINEKDTTENAVVHKAKKGVDTLVTIPVLPSMSNGTQVTQSVGENLKCMEVQLNEKDIYRSILKKSFKFECGSGSGDPDIGQHDENIDFIAKKRKTRRGKPKRRKLKPYSKQSYHHDVQCRLSRIGKSGRQPPAPYNTTQFLMNDHSDLPDLEQKLSEAVSNDISTEFQKPLAPSRTRDSSFSVDSDEDYFYSSPEDEEEFLTKEFSSAYEDLHAERLGNLSKSELIQEYIQLEAKVDLLAKRLRSKNFYQTENLDSENKNINANESETAKKLKTYQQRIDDLLQQNEELRRENETLRSERNGSHTSSIDSESDSDSDSENRNSSNSSSSNTSGSSSNSSSNRSSNNSSNNSSSNSSNNSPCSNCPLKNSGNFSEVAEHKIRQEKGQEHCNSVICANNKFQDSSKTVQIKSSTITSNQMNGHMKNHNTDKFPT